jgi:peroxiredoxin
MKKLSNAILGLCLGLTLVVGPALAEAEVGAPAPAFSAKTTTGQQVKLSDYKGKYVVMEWVNSGCPFVQGQYNPGKMQALQEKWTAKGVVWLSVCSSAPGKQGNMSAQDFSGFLATKKAHASAALLDADGTLGHLYGAKTTPDMFIVDPSGTVIYSGAIDDKSSRNYVDEALSEATSGKKVTVTTTKSYGCSVKYAKE